MKKEKSKVQNEPVFNFRSIKSFEDACTHLGITPELPQLVNGCQELLKPLLAAYKLMVVFKAINNGWIPDWANTDQTKWFPWFWVHSSGADFSRSDSHDGYQCTIVGSRLCCDSSDKCQYIADTFEDLYKDFFLYN